MFVKYKDLVLCLSCATLSTLPLLSYFTASLAMKSKGSISLVTKGKQRATAKSGSFYFNQLHLNNIKPDILMKQYRKKRRQKKEDCFSEYVIF